VATFCVDPESEKRRLCISLPIVTMMSDSAAASPIVVDVGSSSTPKDYLSHFWSLAEIEPSVRVQAAECIVSTLKGLRSSSSEKDFQTSMEYTLKRLVKGLKSSRGGARQGFSTTLCEILKTFFDKNEEDKLETVWKDAVEVTKVCNLLYVLYHSQHDIMSTCLHTIIHTRLTQRIEGSEFETRYSDACSRC
jgi:hypothetical protein